MCVCLCVYILTREEIIQRFGREELVSLLLLTTSCDMWHVRGWLLHIYLRFFVFFALLLWKGRVKYL
ncbi:hypothetical protein FKM82_015345 [Ascaphus truei]